MTILDSIVSTAGAQVLLSAAGEPGAVELNTRAGQLVVPAVVGPLRTEEVTEFTGASERVSHREVCQATIQISPRRLALSMSVVVPRYLDPDGDRAEQAFYVRSIDSVTENFTTCQLWREALAKRQRRGTEGN